MPIPGKLTARTMLLGGAAMLPALLTQIYYFGMGVLVTIPLWLFLSHYYLEFTVTRCVINQALVYISDF